MKYRDDRTQPRSRITPKQKKDWDLYLQWCKRLNDAAEQQYLEEQRQQQAEE